MPDIRNFFGAHGSQNSSSGPRKTVPVFEGEEVKVKKRAKRQIVESDDEIEQPAPKKATPQRALPRKAERQISPRGEEITASEYFSKSKVKQPHAPNTIPLDVREETPQPKIAKSTPRKATPGSARSIRSSVRTTTAKSYAEDIDQEVDGTPVILKDEDSGEDIYQAEFKSRRRDDDDEPVTSSKVNGRTKAEPKTEPKAIKLIMSPKKPQGAKKRKSVESHESGSDAPSAKKKSAPTKSGTTKSKVSKKGAEPESKEIQDILDSVPQIRPPTPPQRDPSQKFNFRAGAQRSGAPPAAGTKEIPTGNENCLVGLAFVFTGILDTLGRDEGIDLVKRYGGKTTGAPGSKTDFVVLGNDAGPKKLETIAKLKIKTINEDGLFDLIRRLPANGGSGKAAAKHQEKKQADEEKIRRAAEQMVTEERAREAPRKAAQAATVKPGVTRPPLTSANINTSVDNRLWTVKYAPTQMNQICGNKTQLEKLQSWLRNWRRSAKSDFKKPGKDGMGLYRAVMIHGGPGIGKTTAAHLAAKLEGFDIVESNASDTRSKKLVETGLRGVFDSTSLLGYFSGDGQKVEADKKQIVLIMDEVDGMSAGDRGGVGALAAVCKKTSVPMILICNERRSPKMKPFDHVTFDLPFRKPTTDQVRTRIMTILYREKMNTMIPASVVNALIEGSNADIRQVINMISTAQVDQQALDFDGGKKMASAWEKHIMLKPWDLVGKILGGGMFASSSKASLNDKIELYFNDFEFAPLMLQENYLNTNPILAHQYEMKQKALKILELTDLAAESISDGDLVDAMIHGSQQQWSLMPTHAIFSFVRPASFVSGSAAGHATRFTSWLGQNSKGGKLARSVKEIQGHMRLRASADRHEIRQQYLPLLWTRLIKGLEQSTGKEDVLDMIRLMDSYFLTKDDWDAILELGIGSQCSENVTLSTQQKTMFTRTYNQMSHPLPFMKSSGTVAPARKSKDKPDLEEAVEESEDEEPTADAAAEDDIEVLDLKKDKYVQAPKKKRVSAKKAGKPKVASDDDNDEDVEVKPKSKARGKAAVSKGKKE